MDDSDSYGQEVATSLRIGSIFLFLGRGKEGRRELPRQEKKRRGHAPPVAPAALGSFIR